MLETRFERIVGDIGNPRSFDFPVHYRTVPGATPERVVHAQDAGLVDLFARQARELVDAGVCAITTSCGFMSRYQNELQARISVPFAASALAYLERLAPVHRGLGVITADSTTLGEEQFAWTGNRPAAVVGLQDAPAFRAAILDGSAPLDPAAIERETVEAGRRLRRDCPDLDAIILECTNLPPYRGALRDALHLPVYDAVSLANLLVQTDGTSRGGALKPDD